MSTAGWSGKRICLETLVSIAIVHREGYFGVGYNIHSVLTDRSSLVCPVGYGSDTDGG